MINKPASETTALWAFILLLVVVGILTACPGCASSVRDLTVTTPDGLTATLHARDVFSETKIRFRAEKTEKGWTLVYGRETDPDEEYIGAATDLLGDLLEGLAKRVAKGAKKGAGIP